MYAPGPFYGFIALRNPAPFGSIDSVCERRNVSPNASAIQRHWRSRAKRTKAKAEGYGVSRSEKERLLKIARLARSAKRIPTSLLDDLAALVAKIEDVQLVRGDIATHLFDLAYCGARCHDAERTNWWGMALARG
jgi:hypothetical protein